MYAVFEGRYFSEPHFCCVFEKKKDAEKEIKKQGYVYNKKQDIYESEELQMYYTIEKCNVNKLERFYESIPVKE